jgi:hypothetical protein
MTQKGEPMSQVKVTLTLALFAVLGVAAAAPVPPHAGAKTKQATHARVSMKTARATALAKVPGGKVQAAELEREHGMLIYSFDIRVPGKSGIEEVQVDAIHGAVVSMAHEGPQAERKEARQEKQEARKGRTDPKARTTGR